MRNLVNYGKFNLIRKLPKITNLSFTFTHLRKCFCINNKSSNLIPQKQNDYSNDLMEYNISSSPVFEPEDYRTIYLDNLPTDWTEEEIKVRLEQLGKIEKLHIIKNSIGERTGRVIAIYSKIDSLVSAIETFKDKMPFFKPVKIRFYREFKNKKANISKNNSDKKSDVLMIKNLPSDLLKADLEMFLSEFKKPIHISYLRDEENEFKRVAIVYFYTIQDAEEVLKYANLRYVKNKQLFIQYSFTHWDLTDFRTRAEIGVKLPPTVELKLFNKQIETFKRILENKGEYTDSDIQKIEYLKMRSRKLEYRIKQLGEELPEDYKIADQSKDNIKISDDKKNTKKLRYEYNPDKSIVFVDNKKLFDK
jgi:RNA recognition motif-containing protein